MSYNEAASGHYIHESDKANIVKFLDIKYKDYFMYGRYRNKMLRNNCGISYGIYVNSSI